MEQDKEQRDTEEEEDDEDEDNGEEFLPGFATFQDYSKVYTTSHDLVNLPNMLVSNRPKQYSVKVGMSYSNCFAIELIITGNEDH